MVIQNSVCGVFSEDSVARTFDLYSVCAFAAAFGCFNLAFAVTVLARVHFVYFN